MYRINAKLESGSSQYRKLPIMKKVDNTIDRPNPILWNFMVISYSSFIYCGVMVLFSM